MEAMSSEEWVPVEPPPRQEVAVGTKDEADEPLQPPPGMEELGHAIADEAAGGSPVIPFVSSAQVPPSVTEELAVGSGEAREEPLQRSEVLNRLQEPPVDSRETLEDRRRSRLLALRAVNPPDIKRSKIRVDKYAPAWQRRRWDYVDHDNLDFLNEKALDHSMFFSIETLQQSFRNYRGKQRSWIEMMNDRNITARHKITDNILDFSGRWRLFDSCADYAEPWKQLTRHDIFREFKDKPGVPWSHYIKDLCRRYEGEVALAWSEWTWSPENLPRAVNLWQPQFATDEASMSKLVALSKASKNPSSEQVFSDDVDSLLVAAANTTVLYAESPSGGHWRRRGNVITLAELLFAFGERCTVSDIMFWYCHAQKLVKKRRHPWANAEQRAAAYLRQKTYGHWGHRRRGSAVGE